MLLLSTSRAIPQSLDITCPRCGERSSVVLPDNAEYALVECTAGSAWPRCGTLLIVTIKRSYGVRRVGDADISNVTKQKASR